MSNQVSRKSKLSIAMMLIAGGGGGGQSTLSTSCFGIFSKI